MARSGVTLLAFLILSWCGHRCSHLGRNRRPAEARAVAYLAGEVPAWRRDHPCYSCHNNGDAARALVAAWQPARRCSRGPRRHAAAGSRTGAMGDATAAAKAAPTTSAWRASSSRTRRRRLTRRRWCRKTAVDAAAAIVAADQQPDGSWRLDSSDSIGSPATYGTALATVFARRTLIASGLPALAGAHRRAEPLARTGRSPQRARCHGHPLCVPPTAPRAASLTTGARPSSC